VGAPIALIALERVQPDDGVVLDTSVLIAFLGGDEAASAVARSVMESLVRTERNRGIVSSVSVAELMVRPILEGGRRESLMRAFLLAYPGLEIRSADVLVAAEAARIRGVTGATLPDALIAATAVLTSSRWLITNDRRLRDSLAGFDWATEVLLLSELEVGADGTPAPGAS